MSQLGQDVSAKDEKKFQSIAYSKCIPYCLKGHGLDSGQILFFLFTYNALGMHSQYSNEI